MKNHILIACIILLTVSLFFSVKEGEENQNTQNEAKVPEVLRTLEEDYRKKIYETTSETVINGLNKENIKTPACNAECVIDQEKISQSLYTIDNAHSLFLVRVLYTILNDVETLNFVTEILGDNSPLLNRPPINIKKEELRMIIRIINNLKKNKIFMGLLDKVNNLVKR